MIRMDGCFRHSGRQFGRRQHFRLTLPHHMLLHNFGDSVSLQCENHPMNKNSLKYGSNKQSDGFI